MSCTIENIYHIEDAETRKNMLTARFKLSQTMDMKAFDLFSQCQITGMPYFRGALPGQIYDWFIDTFAIWENYGKPLSLVLPMPGQNQLGVHGIATGISHTIQVTQSSLTICDCGKEKHNFSHHIRNCPADKGE